MKQTKYFDLTLPDGSDYVNPLTQTNPNFTVIDRVMFDNLKGSLRHASNATKSGSSFIMTIDNVATQFFTFIAPADFEKGDQIVINTKTFNPIDQSGKELDAKAFVGGAAVYCILSNSDPCSDSPCKPQDLTSADLLTVFVNTGSGGGTGIAEDSKKLGGQLPSYYAKQEDLNKLNNTVKSIEVVRSIPSATIPNTLYLLEV